MGSRLAPATTSAPASDTLLPGRSGDNLLPRRRADPARSRRLIVAVVVAVALAVSAWAAARMVFTSGSSGDNAPTLTSADRRAKALLRDAAAAARTVFMQEGTYERITTAVVEDRAPGIRIVAAGTIARSGTVSIRVSDQDTLILATPGSPETCIFARDEPMKSVTAFAVARGKPCAATKAPRAGWDS